MRRSQFQSATLDDFVEKFSKAKPADEHKRPPKPPPTLTLVQASLPRIQQLLDERYTFEGIAEEFSKLGRKISAQSLQAKYREARKLAAQQTENKPATPNAPGEKSPVNPTKLRPLSGAQLQEAAS